MIDRPATIASTHLHSTITEKVVSIVARNVDLKDGEKVLFIISSK